MSTTVLVRMRVLIRAIVIVIGVEHCSFAQTSSEPVTGDASSAATELKLLKAERKRFQQQELITAKRNNWVFKAGEPPRIVWRDSEEVRRLGVKKPLSIRWFNAELKEVAVPRESGRWCAWVEGTAPNGSPLRRAFTFYSPPQDAFVFLLAPKITVSFDHLPQTTAGQLWREHEAEIGRLSTNLLRRNFADSETVAIMLAGLATAKPQGRPARFAESFNVANEDYHLKLKLKMLKLQNQVRPLQPPRTRQNPARTLRKGTPKEAAMLPDAKKRLDAVCRDWVEDTGEPFVSLVARNGVIVSHEAFGEDSDGKKIGSNYRCWVGSITKSVTALLYSQFLDQGLIGLDDSVSTVFPDYPQGNSRAPTFRQCFNHTSGLSGHGDFGGFRNPHLENIILNAIDVNEPNAHYAYSGTGYELAVKAMEIVSGKSGVRLYDEHLFRPLHFGDVPIANASSDGRFTAQELAVMAQLVANRGSYGKFQFISPDTFAKLLPRPVLPKQSVIAKEHGIGLHWARKLKPGSPANSLRPEHQILSLNTVGHGSFSGCMFMIDLDQGLVIAQVRRRTGPRWSEWSLRFFQAIADSIRKD